jgi:hypothetical protein
VSTSRPVPACAAAAREVREILLLTEGLGAVVPPRDFVARVAAKLEGELEPASREVAASAGLVALLAFVGERFRASRRFRLVTLSAAAHLVLLALLTLFVVPATRREASRVEVRFSAEQIQEMERALTPEEPGEPARPSGELLASRLDELLPAPEPALPEPRLHFPTPTRDDGFERTRPGRRFPTDAVAALMLRRLPGTRPDRPGPDGDAVDRSLAGALRWLAKRQEADGSWPSGADYPGYREGVTGLALLAFLGDGHSVHRGNHRATVARGIAWLRSRQGEDGRIGDPDFARPMYGHAIATLALLEAWALDYELRQDRRSLQREIGRAVRFILAAQKADGGWRYRPRAGAEDRSAGDASVTIWQLLALELARDGGFEVPGEAIVRAREFLRSRTRTEDGAQGYQEAPGDGRTADATLTAGVLACSRALGLPREDVERRSRLVRRALPSGDDHRNPLLWFYATHGLRRTASEGFAGWRAFAFRTLLETQRGDGSWAPDVLYGPQGGAVYATAMGALVLAVDHRVNPEG